MTKDVNNNDNLMESIIDLIWEPEEDVETVAPMTMCWCGQPAPCPGGNNRGPRTLSVGWC